MRENQTAVMFYVSDEFKKEIRRHLLDYNYSSISQFAREALVNKMKKDKQK